MASNARKYSNEGLSIEFDNSVANQIQSFFKDAVNELYRPSAYAASTVLYDEVVTRVPVKTGTLKNAIYRFRDKGDNGERSIFYVGVNKRKAPHWHLIEHGHVQPKQAILLNGKWVTLDRPSANPKFIPAKPFFRPSVDAKLKTALAAGITEFKKRFNQK